MPLVVLGPPDVVREVAIHRAETFVVHHHLVVMTTDGIAPPLIVNAPTVLHGDDPTLAAMLDQGNRRFRLASGDDLHRARSIEGS